MLDSSANAVSAVVIGLLAAFGGNADTKPPTQTGTQVSTQASMVWSGGKLEDPRETPIELRLASGDRHPFVTGWKNTANSPLAMGQQTKYEAGFAIGGTYGRIRVMETTTRWVPATPTTTIGNWLWVNEHNPTLGADGTVIHGPITFDYVRFQLTRDGVREDCVGYVGTKDRVLIDGYACGKPGGLSSHAAIVDFIQAIGYPDVLDAKPLALTTREG